MSDVIVINGLYRELLIVSLIVMAIMLINNLVLYRQKLTGLFSMMLVFGAIMCVFELLWDVFDDHASYSSIIYICAGLYTIAFLNFEGFFNRYFLERFGIPMRKKWMTFICYGIPNVVIGLLCVTTPWTHLFYKVDDAGIIQEMPLCSILFYGIMWIYSLSAIGVALNYLLRAKKDANTGKIARSLLIYAVLQPSLYIMQNILLGEAITNYLTMSLPVSISLVYLTARVNIHAMLESRAQVEAIEADMRVAARIQMDALPPTDAEFPEHPGIELCATINTAKEVGGDFYDYFAIDEDRICFLIADVSGKGMPAALFMMTAKTTIKDYALTRESTSEIFTAVNERLCENNDEGMFATAWIGILDTRTMTLQFTNAGHDYPVLMKKGDEPSLLKKKHGLFLGGMEGIKYRIEEMELAPGDRLLLYTDGVREAMNPYKEQYGPDRMLAVVDSTREQHGAAVMEEMLKDVEVFEAGEPQFDDKTMVVLTIR